MLGYFDGISHPSVNWRDRQRKTGRQRHRERNKETEGKEEPLIPFAGRSRTDSPEPSLAAFWRGAGTIQATPLSLDRDHSQAALILLLAFHFRNEAVLLRAYFHTLLATAW